MSEIALWALISLVALAASNVLGALLARGDYSRLNQIYDEIAASGRMNDGDRAWLRVAFYDSVARWHIRVAAIAAPLLAVVLPVLAVSELLKRQPTEAIDRDIDELHRSRAIIYGDDPTEGEFWNDPVRPEAQELAMSAEWKRSPLLSVWIGLWLLPGFLVSLALFGASHAVLKVYKLVAEELAAKITAGAVNRA